MPDTAHAQTAPYLTVDDHLPQGEKNLVLADIGYLTWKNEEHAGSQVIFGRVAAGRSNNRKNGQSSIR